MGSACSSQWLDFLATEYHVCQLPPGHDQMHACRCGEKRWNAEGEARLRVKLGGADK